jgi:methylamine dehydrogenase accessory protein MauD
MDAVSSNIIALWSIVGIEFVVIVLLVRQIGLISLRLPPARSPLPAQQGLELGTEAPEFTALELKTGRTLSMSEFLGNKLLLFFISPTCGPCHRLLPQLAEFWRGVDHDGIEVILISSGEASTNEELLHQFKIPFRILLQSETERADELYRVSGITPFVFAVDSERRIRFKGLVQSAGELDQLVEFLDQPYHEHSSDEKVFVDVLEGAETQ